MFGTAEQKEKWLTDYASGKKLGLKGELDLGPVNETDCSRGGHDHRSGAASTVAVKDGDHFVIAST
eukprot:760443-Hanusia_phi.AAC.4